MTIVAPTVPIVATEGVPKYDGPATYDGPSPGWLIENHKLAHQIIACHSIEAMKVLDTPSLAFLRLYVENPTNKTELLTSQDMLDKEGEKLGTRASQKYGSLVGYAIANDAFNEDEIQMLRTWFESGVLDEELERVELNRAGRNVMLE